MFGGRGGGEVGALPLWDMGVGSTGGGEERFVKTCVWLLVQGARGRCPCDMGVGSYWGGGGGRGGAGYV